MISWKFAGAAAIVLVSGLATEAGPSAGRTYHVATDGDDGNPGDVSKPLRTVGKAASLARAGDTILLRGGVYREAVLLRFSGVEGQPIVLKSFPGEQPVIQPGERGERPPGQGVLLQAQEGYQKPIGWITIEGLEIRYGWDGVKFYNAHDVAIRNCRIHDNFNQGILGNGNRVLIDRNLIAGNGTNQGARPNLMHGIYATGSAFTITNNVIHSNSAYGIQVAAYDYNKDSMAGPEYAEAKDWLIANNTLAFNKHRAGIVVWQDGVENCVVQNNIFYKNAGSNGIDFYSQRGRRHRVRNNIFHPPGESLVSSEADAYRAIDNREIDPRFADPDSFDFRLQAGSPAIDAGSADRAPKVDFEGKPRPQGGGVDIGAYESTPDPAPPSARGPLRVHPTNPRYFTDGSGKAVYLTGSHTWNNLQDLGLIDPPPAFNFDAHLDFLDKRHHNFIRLWRWELSRWNEAADRRLRYCAPHPWPRPGPGNALDGKPKFDLESFDAAYFQRLRARTEAAARRGIYVSIMLFEGWGLSYASWDGHPFNVRNNVQGINGDPDGNGKGTETQALVVPEVTRIQEAYVRKVIDTVNDLDNVLFEIANESLFDFSKGWHYHMIRYVKEYERTKPKQHPVGMTGYTRSDNQVMWNGPADWISPGGTGNTSEDGPFKSDPPAADGRKVLILDTDHLWGSGGGVAWVWKSFLRGYHPIWMDAYDGSSGWESLPPDADPVRRNLGETRRFAERMNLAAMTPRNDLASSRYCLAQPGREYLVYLPSAGRVTVDLSQAPGAFAADWFHPATGAAKQGELVRGGGSRMLTSPFGDGEAVLYLKATP